MFASRSTRIALLGLLTAGLLWAVAETIRPTAIEAQSGFTACVVGSIDEDPDSPDASWCNVGGANNVTTSVRVSFPTPANGNPVTTTNAQQVRTWLRKTNHPTDPTCTLLIYENGTQIVSVIGSNVSSTTGVIVSGNWTYSGFTNADGSGLEVQVDCATGGGNPNNRASGEVGAIELNLDVAEAGGARRRAVIVAEARP